jgi:hypothetical protein
MTRFAASGRGGFRRPREMASAKNTDAEIR